MTPTLEDWRERAERAEAEGASLRAKINDQIDRLVSAQAALREREAELAEAVGLLCGAKPPDVCYDVPAWTAARDRLTGVARHPAPARSGEVKP